MVAVSGAAVRRGEAWSPPSVTGTQLPSAGGGASARHNATSSVRLPTSTYRRRRAVAAGLFVVLLLVVRAALGMLGGGPLAAPERPNYSDAAEPGATYVVQPGDTFWVIAHRLKPEGDPRPLVDRLVAAHHGPTLYVGERIPLPPL